MITKRLPGGWAARRTRSAGGGPGSGRIAVMVGLTSRGRAVRRRSRPSRLRTLWSQPASRYRRTRRIGPGRRWPSARPVQVHDRADLEVIRAETAPPGRVQALQRSTVRRERYDVVGLYLNPPEAVVLCTEEKSHVQALARSQPAFPMMPGRPAKRTLDYVRHGTTSLGVPSLGAPSGGVAAFNTDDGTVISRLHRRHPGLGNPGSSGGPEIHGTHSGTKCRK